MSIDDLALNALLPASSSNMLGFQVIDADEDPLTSRIYLQLTQGIRDADQQDGNQFLERFLEGPQEIWASTTQTIRALPDFWSVTRIPDQFLPYLKNIVGWTSDFDLFTCELTYLQLRRLIAASVPFWKSRGTETSLDDIVSLVTGARTRVLNWFDFRYITDVSAVGEDHAGYDPWIVTDPPMNSGDEFRYNLRVVDDTTLNRVIVRELVKLSRPVGEICTITYLGFLDLFKIDNDKSQWTDDASSVAGVSDGTYKFTDAGEVVESGFVSTTFSGSFSNYTATWKLRGSDVYGVQFYRTGVDDFYAVRLTVSLNKWEVLREVASVETVLDSGTFPLPVVELNSDIYNAIRIEVLPDSGTTRIRFYLDAEKIFEDTDSSHDLGTMGVFKAASGTVELDELEMFFNPLESEEVGPSS